MSVKEGVESSTDARLRRPLYRRLYRPENWSLRSPVLIIRIIIVAVTIVVVALIK